LFITGNSGFPKATNLSKAFDAGSGRPEDIRRAAMGDDYEPSGRGRVNYDHGAASVMNGVVSGHAPATDAAKQWNGWFYGLQSLKPAMEPWLMFQKPHEGRMTDNVLKWGTGAINVDGCRVETSEELRIGSSGLLSHVRDGKAYPNTRQGEASAETRYQEEGGTNFAMKPGPRGGDVMGRWPANLLHDGSEAVVAMFPESKWQQGDVRGTEQSRTGGDGTNCYGEFGRVATPKRDDKSGSAARFFNTFPPEEHNPLFYCPKASKADREEGLHELPDGTLARSCQAQADAKRGNFVHEGGGAFNKARVRKNTHATVKPTALMRHLVRLITPPGGTCLDPFMGSGSTGKAAILEGFHFVGIEREAEYIAIAEARIRHATPEKPLAPVKINAKPAAAQPATAQLSLLD
jgi:site-specific DNA-methyltransferase (adenine-specific)